MSDYYRMRSPDYATVADGLSFVSCFLALKGQGDSPRHATGFFWRREDRTYLITNWHVVTGINIFTGESVSRNWCPEEIVVEYFETPTNDEHGMRMFGVPQIKIPLFVDFHSPLWIQHQRTFQSSIDIIAIEISKAMVPDQGKIRCIQDFQFSKLLHFAGSDIFVLGHPFPKSYSRYPASFPIWKRGSIASEIIIPWNMRPAFLIDCRTSRGMSGSPVFSRAFGPTPMSDLTINGANIRTSEFMGVYSGRLHDDQNIPSLGLVWHRTLIDEIIDNPAPGDRQWQSSPTPETFALV